MTHPMKVTSVLGGALAGMLAASMLALAPNAAAAPSTRLATTAGTLPTVTEIPYTSGSHGYPYDAATTTASFAGAPTLNLAARGYAEREFTGLFPLA